MLFLALFMRFKPFYCSFRPPVGTIYSPIADGAKQTNIRISERNNIKLA